MYIAYYQICFGEFR